jgi:beta-phosphoglucomutase
MRMTSTSKISHSGSYQTNKSIHPDYAFFDMDGTLVETDYANFLAYEKAISTVLKGKSSIEFDPKLRFDKNSLKHHFQDLSEFHIKRIIQLKNFLVHEFLSETFVNSEVIEQFISISEVKKIVLVTNANSERAMDTMRFHGLDRYFSDVFCSDHRIGYSNKYQHSIDALRADAFNVQVFENEDKEIANAITSGVLRKNIIKV